MTKPDYRVPLMSEIADLPWNGFNAISTFSGCGGSSLGYKMAGFRVLWASEFIPSAQQTYRANHPKTILDTRDIRQVKAEEILAAIGMKRGELDLFDGSPPCASFSTAGSREAGWGKVKKYSDGAQRTDDLFHEFIRLVRGIQPKVFVAENVSGLVKGTAKGYFLEILAAMKASGYRVTCRVLDAQWLGVPQQRQRTIFVGVRNDLNLEPVHPLPLPYRYSVRDALPWITDARQTEVFNEPDRVFTDTPSPSVTTLGIGAKRNDSVVVEAETDISRYAIGAEWDKLKPGEGSEKYLNLKRTRIEGPSHGISADGGNPSTAGVCHPTEKRKFTIAELRRICAFPDDFILLGTYAQQWERLGRAVPPVMMSHIAATVRDEILRKL
jgi:DNA (cytosine-5)-methyltransferase 1